MRYITFKRAFMQLFALVMLGVMASGFTAKLGLDSYEVFLNDKLILKQSVNQPLSLRKLQLGKATDRDQLRIYYKHCHGDGVGTDRSISIKDDKGNSLKRWKFADATDSNSAMVISVKELSQLEKKNAHQDLSLHYSAQELPEGEMLAVCIFE